MTVRMTSVKMGVVSAVVTRLQQHKYSLPAHKSKNTLEFQTEYTQISYHLFEMYL